MNDLGDTEGLKQTAELLHDLLLASTSEDMGQGMLKPQRLLELLLNADENFIAMQDEKEVIKIENVTKVPLTSMKLWSSLLQRQSWKEKYWLRWRCHAKLRIYHANHYVIQNTKDKIFNTFYDTIKWVVTHPVRSKMFAESL